MIINDLDGYYIVFDTKNWNTELDTLSNKTMDLRSYTKQELALLYFPDATPAVASAHLMRWIQRIPDLLQKLAATGYGKNCKEFTPMQVSYILYFLGEP